MTSSNRLGFFFTLAALAVGYWGFAQKATAIVIYQENFTGLATAALNGKIPDTDNNGGSNTWTADTGYKQDGTTPTASVNQGAFLPFTPLTGNIYTLTASFTGVGPDGTSVAWHALGFGKGLPSGADNRFISGTAVGRAWMLFRANTPTTPTDSPNKIQLGNVSSGTASGLNWTDSTLARGEGGDIDLQIVLNTNPTTWTADFFAKRPTATSYTEVSAGPLSLLAQDIGVVGIARTSGTLTGKLTKFKLEMSDVAQVLGDVDGNGVVNDVDFGIIRDHLFQTGTRTQGDLTGDGLVDFSDFRQWKTAVGSGAGAGASFEAAVPEPASVLLALIATAVGSIAGQRRRRTARQLNL
jgi:hypothetical protein